jgi:isopentenyl-diphosphate delta-isomerase
MEVINADIIAFHLNYLQELVQPEGEHRSRGALHRLSELSKTYPIIAKETGAGISKEMALVLKKCGVIGIDVGGAGGTSFSAVEYYRAKKRADKKRELLGKLFWDWGIPAPASIYSIRNIGLPIIGSGGIKTGLDIAKAIVLGANVGGIARELLPYAADSLESVMARLEEIIYELKATMFLLNAKTIKDLQTKGFIVHNRTKDWIEQL